MVTATEAHMQLDLKRNRAVQYATMIVHELSEAGVIADRCRSEAQYHLADLFYKADVEMTSAEERRARSVISSLGE